MRSALAQHGQFGRTIKRITAAPPVTWFYTAVVAVTDFTTTSTSYVDLLDAAAGNPFTVTATLDGTQDVLISTGGSYQHSASPGTFVIGVEADDGVGGVTDYDITLFTTRTNINVRRNTEGQKLLTGLAAGNWTFTVRVKVVTPGTFTHFVGDRTFIRALACDL